MHRKNHVKMSKLYIAQKQGVVRKRKHLRYLNEQHLKGIFLLQDRCILHEYTIYGRLLDAQDNQQCGLGVWKGYLILNNQRRGSGVGNYPLECNKKIIIRSICDFFVNVTDLCWFMFAPSFSKSSRVGWGVKPGA